MPSRYRRAGRPKSRPCRRRRRPDEATALESLGVKRQAEPVMPKHLDQIAPATPEDIKVAGCGRNAALPGPEAPAYSCLCACGPTDRQPTRTPDGTGIIAVPEDRARAAAPCRHAEPTRIRYLPASSISIVSPDAAPATIATLGAVTVTGTSTGPLGSAGASSPSR